MKQEVLERPRIVTYKVMAYNVKDFGSTKDMENAMELRLEQCLTGLSKQGVNYEVAFYSAGYLMVCIIKHWY